MEDCRHLERGIALIVEGATEKTFYQVYLERCCDRSPRMEMRRALIGGDIGFVVRQGSDCERLVLFHSMDTITQMPNAGSWFNRVCVEGFPGIPWDVFLCYDADEYSYPISKFHEGDWETLRSEIEAHADTVFDLAAQADIEDIMLCDYSGVLAWLELPPETPIPSGRNGKNRLRRLFRLSGVRGAYHAGERSRPLIETLSMKRIEANAPFDLRCLRECVFGNLLDLTVEK